MNPISQYDGDFCAFCGSTFDRSTSWPRPCPECQGVTEEKHIPLITVLHQSTLGIQVAATMPRSGRQGIFLPSTFLDFGETWRQAAARCIGVSSEEVRFRSFDVLTLDAGITNIFALVEGDADLEPIGSSIRDANKLSDANQLKVANDWLGRTK